MINSLKSITLSCLDITGISSSDGYEASGEDYPLGEFFPLLDPNIFLGGSFMLGFYILTIELCRFTTLIPFCGELKTTDPCLTMCIGDLDLLILGSWI